jgi:hypothetical protein
MAPHVVSVRPLPEFRLDLEFSSGEHRIFDVKPYFKSEVFKQLREEAVFATARVVAGSVEWHGATPLSSPALSFDTLYIDSVPSSTCDSVSA